MKNNNKKNDTAPVKVNAPPTVIPALPEPPVPEKVVEQFYHNSETSKAQILSYNTNKAGIYMWTNLISDKCYIGSAVNLSDRLSFYFSTKAMENSLKNSKSYIYSALLKYGHYNFSLTILEYCEPEQCLEREDFYLSSLPHEYNILQKAGSWLGHNHSDDAKTKISDAHKKIDHPGRFKAGHNHSEEIKTKISDTLKGHKGASQPASVAIEVLDKDNNKTTTYESIRAAARALNISKSVIDSYFSNNQQKPYKGRYTFLKTK